MMKISKAAGNQAHAATWRKQEDPASQTAAMRARRIVILLLLYVAPSALQFLILLPLQFTSPVTVGPCWTSLPQGEGWAREQMQMPSHATPGGPLDSEEISVVSSTRLSRLQIGQRLATSFHWSKNTGNWKRCALGKLTGMDEYTRWNMRSELHSWHVGFLLFETQFTYTPTHTHTHTHTHPHTHARTRTYTHMIFAIWWLLFAIIHISLTFSWHFLDISFTFHSCHYATTES